MKRFSAIFAAVLLAGVVASSNASEVSDLRLKLSAARASLVTMVFYKDQRGADQQKLVKETADGVSAQLAQMKPPAGKEASFKELVETWNAFKETREKELVPAILKGDDEAVRKMVWGIQKDRFTKCMVIVRGFDNHASEGSGNDSGFGELGLRLAEARTSLLIMMRHRDKRGADQQRLVNDTAEAVSTQLAEIKAPDGKEAQFKELVEIWKAFKETREKQLVPAILSGNDEEASRIAHGIQQDRITKFQAILKELDNFRGVPAANAGEFDDFRAKLSPARESLLAMLLDARRRGAEQQKLVKDSADAVSAQLEKMKAPAGKAAKFNELVETWRAFKETREKDLVPAILKGKEDEAKKISYGIQNERIKKLLSLAKELEM